MVESTGLLSRRTFTGTQRSNPSLSANLSYIRLLKAGMRRWSPATSTSRIWSPWVWSILQTKQGKNLRVVCG